MEDFQSLIHIGNYAYTEKYCLGQGSFGKVYKGIETIYLIGKNKFTDKTVAIKQIEANSVTESQVQKQISILKQFQHKNIVQYEDAFKNGEFFYIVTQYCNGGDLRNIVGDSDQSQNQDSQVSPLLQKIIDMFFQICEGFEYLRKFQIVHRDLKPSNILIHNGIYKIADFGLAKTQQLNKSIIQSDLKGVPIYMSPQILSRNFYTYKCDVWSLGIIVFQLYYDKLPWKANDVDHLFFEIMKHPQPYYQQKKRLPSMLRNILDGTLKYLQKQRLTWGQFLALQKGRKKIFSRNQSGSSHLSKVNEQDNKDASRFTRSELAGNVQKRQEISPSKIDQSIKDWQAQILNHVRAQCQSLSQQLQSIVTQQCLSTFIDTLEKYLKQGLDYKQCLRDCSLILVRRASENLHIYMIELQSLQDARDLLILLQLITNILYSEMKPGQTLQDFEKKSNRSQNIEIFAAEVINLMNSFMIKGKSVIP